LRLGRIGLRASLQLEMIRRPGCERRDGRPPG
jgi:hypothetical protein